MQVYIRRCFIICMCKILVQNFIIKDILKKEKRCSLNFCTDYICLMNMGRAVLLTWAELACAEFYVGQFGMGRVGFGPSCP